MRGRKRHLKKAAKMKAVQATKKSSCKSCGCKKKASPAKQPVAAPEVVAAAGGSKFSYYGKSKVCHIVSVDGAGVVTALCGDVWTPGDEKDAPTIIDAITDDRRLCKKCEKKQ